MGCRFFLRDLLHLELDNYADRAECWQYKIGQAKDAAVEAITVKTCVSGDCSGLSDFTSLLSVNFSS